MAYRDSTTNSGSSNAPSVAVPSGVAIGDIVILVATIDASAANFQAGDWPTGFTELQEADVTTDGHSAAIGWKRLTAADSGSYTFGNVGASADWIAQAYAFSGRHATNPPVATVNVQNTGQTSPNTVTATGVTAVEGDDLLWVSAPDVTGSGDGTGHTAPTDFTEREDAENLWSNLSGATRDDVAAGATGNISGTFTHNNTAGWAAFLVRIPEGGAAAQNISPSGIATAEAFGTATITTGAVTVSPTAIASAEAFGTASINLTVAPSGIASAEAFGSPTLTTSYTITGTGIASAEAFGTATITPGAVTVSPTGIVSAEAFGTATVSIGASTISPTGIESAEAFGAPTVTPGAVTVSPGAIASAEAFGTATITSSGLSLLPVGIPSAEAFGNATITTGAVSVSPSSIASAEAFGAATLAASYTINAQGIGSAEAFGSPTVNLLLAIVSPPSIASAEVFGSVVVGGGGPPLALAIDNRSFAVSWIDDRSASPTWIDSRSIAIEWSDNRSIGV